MVTAFIITTIYFIFSFFLYKKVIRPEYEKRLLHTLQFFIVLSTFSLFITVLFFDYFYHYYEQEDIITKKYSVPTSEFVDNVHNPANTVQVERNFIYINKGTDNQEVYFIYRDNIVRFTNSSQAKDFTKLLNPF